MTVYIKELKQSFRPLCIWTTSIGLLTLVCILLFPEMKNEMDSVRRFSVVTQKLLSVLTQVILLNLFVVGVSVISAAAIGEELQMKEFVLLHTAYLIMQLEISCICFGVSAFIKRGSIGTGLGLALALYFMNLVCNISEQAEFLRYITPYAYAEASNIISEARLNTDLIAVGAAIAVIGAAAGYLRYLKKDIAS